MKAILQTASLAIFIFCSTLQAQYRYLRLNVPAVIGTTETQVELYGYQYKVGTARYVASPFLQQNLPSVHVYDRGVGNEIMPDGIILKTAWTLDKAPQSFSVHGSNDNSTWTLIETKTNLSTANYNNATDTEITFTLNPNTPPAPYAPWTKGGDKLYNLEEKIGIGTSNPSDKLEVIGTAKATTLRATGETWTQDLYVDRWLLAKDANFSQNVAITGALQLGTDWKNSLSFEQSKLVFKTNDLVRMSIGDNGNVSVTGLLNVHDLDLKGAITQNGQPVSFVTQVNNYQTIQGNTNVTGQLKIGSNSLYLGSTSSGSAGTDNYIYTDGGALEIQNQTAGFQHTILNKNGGNVGIGVAVPLAKLHVNGDIRFNSTTNGITFADGYTLKSSKGLLYNGADHISFLEQVNIVGDNPLLRVGSLVLQDFTTYLSTTSGALVYYDPITGQYLVTSTSMNLKNPEAFVFGNILYDEVTQKYMLIEDYDFILNRRFDNVNPNGSTSANFIANGRVAIRFNSNEGNLEFIAIDKGLFNGFNNQGQLTRDITKEQLFSRRSVIMKGDGTTNIGLPTNALSSSHSLLVYGSTSITGNSTVDGSSLVKGNSTVSGNNLVKGNNNVDGNSLVKGNLSTNGNIIGNGIKVGNGPLMTDLLPSQWITSSTGIAYREGIVGIGTYFFPPIDPNLWGPTANEIRAANESLNNITLPETKLDIKTGEGGWAMNIESNHIFKTDLIDFVGIRLKLQEVTDFAGISVKTYNDSESSSLDLYAGSSSKMTVLHDGKVFIGAQPTVSDYKLSVDGKVICKELSLNIDYWPDNVFEKNYALTSLPEIEKYISQNKHLPNVPSETELKTNGLNTVEMFQIQMKKIEELTLLLIQQNKELEALKVLVNKKD